MIIEYFLCDSTLQIALNLKSILGLIPRLIRTIKKYHQFIHFKMEYFFKRSIEIDNS